MMSRYSKPQGKPNRRSSNTRVSFSTTDISTGTTRNTTRNSPRRRSTSSTCRASWRSRRTDRGGDECGRNSRSGRTKRRRELKDSYFDGYEYKGLKVKTRLAIEGGKRYRPLTLSTPEDVYKAFSKLAYSDKERFYSILLDAKNHVIGVDMVSQGSIGSAPFAPRDVYKSALLASAASVIFVHPHPSGDPEPSYSDMEITNQLMMAGEMMGIDVLDHVIIGRDRYYSFSEKGKICNRRIEHSMKSESD
jgi:DNA repair protein RadC